MCDPSDLARMLAAIMVQPLPITAAFIVGDIRVPFEASRRVATKTSRSLGGSHVCHVAVVVESPRERGAWDPCQCFRPILSPSVPVSFFSRNETIPGARPRTSLIVNPPLNPRPPSAYISSFCVFLRFQRYTMQIDLISLN